MKGAILCFFFCLVWLLPGCARFGCSLPEPGNTYLRSIAFEEGRSSRDYHIHIPLRYDPKKRIPLLIILHGSFSSGSEIERLTGFSSLADRENLLVAYPESHGMFTFLKHWNAGFCCGKATLDGWDDVGFIKAVIQDVSRHFPVDLNRIYLAGFSNGGMLAFRFAAEQSHLVAAVATVSAAIGAQSDFEQTPWTLSDPRTPVPVLAFHGLSDDSVPYFGGRSTRHRIYSFASVRDSIQFWILHNDCLMTPASYKSICNGMILHQQWKGRTEENEVVLYTIADWGHEWPGRGRRPPFTCQGETFDAAEIMWNFFKRHHGKESVEDPAITAGIKSPH
ncbi:MAG: alpha/beta hydrolase family esterase [Desulfovibrionales bacterium]